MKERVLTAILTAIAVCLTIALGFMLLMAAFFALTGRTLP